MTKQVCIYKITNIENEKNYIGQTNNFARRKREHKTALKRGVHSNNLLQNSWKKYGEEKFVFEELQWCEKDEVDELEKFWITFFHSNNTDFGYNLESGGSLLKEHHELTKRKLSRNSKKLWADENYRAKTLKRLIRKGKDNNMAKKVICIDTGEIFDTMTEAAEKKGVNMKNISQVCIGEKISTGGMQFAYYEEGKYYELKKIPSFKGGENPRAKEIICINDKRVFPSITECGEFYNIPRVNITQVLLNKSKCTFSSCGKPLQFAYYEKDKEYTLQEIDNKSYKQPKKVILLNTNEVFESATRAAATLGLQQSKISLVCNGKRSYHGKTENGEKLKWAFYEKHLSI